MQRWGDKTIVLSVFGVQSLSVQFFSVKRALTSSLRVDCIENYGWDS